MYCIYHKYKISAVIQVSQKVPKLCKSDTPSNFAHFCKLFHFFILIFKSQFPNLISNLRHTALRLLPTSTVANKSLYGAKTLASKNKI